MPYKNATMKIPRELDRRRRVTEDMAENMRTIYRDGASIRSIALEFSVDRRTVKWHVLPEYREAEREKQRAGKTWREKYDRERAREYMKEHRRYKRTLEKEGRLK